MAKSEKKQKKLLRKNRKALRQLSRLVRRAAKAAVAFNAGLPKDKDLKSLVAGQKPKILKRLARAAEEFRDEMLAVRPRVELIGHTASLELDVPGRIKKAKKNGKK